MRLRGRLNRNPLSLNWHSIIFLPSEQKLAEDITHSHLEPKIGYDMVRLECSNKSSNVLDVCRWWWWRAWSQCMTQINGGTREMMILTNNALVSPGESLPAWAAVGIVPRSTDVWSGGETTGCQWWVMNEKSFHLTFLYLGRTRCQHHNHCSYH